MPDNYYDILEIAETASDEQIKKAYQYLAKQYHPDRVPDNSPRLKQDAEEKLKQINEAYDVLSDPDKRRQYNDLLINYREEEQKSASYNNQPDSQPTSSSFPQLEVNKRTFEFLNIRKNSHVSDSFTISNVGGGILSGVITINGKKWLTVSQSNIDTTRHKQDIAFHVDTSGLAFGFRDTGTIEIQSNGGTEIVNVTISIEPNIAARKRRNKYIAAGVGLSILIFIIVVIIVGQIHEQNQLMRVQDVAGKLPGEWQGKVSDKEAKLIIAREGGKLSGKIIYDGVEEKLSVRCYCNRYQCIMVELVGTEATYYGEVSSDSNSMRGGFFKKLDNYKGKGKEWFVTKKPRQTESTHQRYVDDGANIVSDAVEKDLNGYLRELEQKTGAQMIVLTINTTGSIPIETYAIKLATKWKLGQRGKNNGVLVVIAKDDRAYRIEVGYGLEGVLPDGFCGTIGRTYFVPKFQEGHFSEGIYQGVVAIGNKITKDSKMSSPASSATVESPATINISGEWEGKIDNKPANLSIAQDGNSLSGNIVYDTESSKTNVKEFLSGEINNDKIVLKGTGYTAKGVTGFSLDTFSGMISSQDGDFIRGNYTDEDGHSGTWFVTKSKSSPQVAAQKSISNDNILSEEEVETFIEKRVNNFINFKIDEIMKHYADDVDFWEYGFVTKDFIRQKIISRNKEWPNREYRISSSITVIPGNTDNEKTAQYTVHSIFKNDRKTMETNTYCEKTLRKRENQILIIREKGEKRDQQIKDNLDYKRRKNGYEYEYRSKGPLDLRGNFQFRWK